MCNQNKIKLLQKKKKNTHCGKRVHFEPNSKTR